MTRAALWVVVAIGGALFAPPAQAYLCSREATGVGPSHFWPVRDVELNVYDKAGEEVSVADIEAAIDFAIAQWNGVECSDFVLRRGPGAQDPRAVYDWAAGAFNENVVVVRQKAENDAVDDWLHPVSALAITTATYVRPSGKVLDTDIEINDAAFVFSACDPGPGCTVRHDLTNTLVHEVGHVVGLDHPLSTQPGAATATMFASAPEGDLQKRDLDQDDIDGICFLYPTGGETGACYPEVPREEPPDVTITEVGGCASTGAGGALWPLLVLVVRFRKRRPGDTS